MIKNLLLIIFTMSVATIILLFFMSRNKKKRILFCGFRQTGKTKCINYLLGEQHETLPTLEPYEVSVGNYKIKEQVFDQTVHFEDYDLCVCFLRNNKDVEIYKDKLENKKTSFVMFKKCAEKINNVIYLDEDYSKINVIF